MSSWSARFWEKSSWGLAKMLTRLVSRSTLACPSPSLLESLKSGKSLWASRLLACTSFAMTWVLILSPMSLLPRSASMSVKLAPLGIVTGGAKSVLSPYLSVMYLMNRMNRT